MFQKIRFLPLSLCFAFLKTSASACAVCFGNNGESWNQGFTWGVAFLVMLPFVMMAGFAWWIGSAIRKKTSH